VSLAVNLYHTTDQRGVQSADLILFTTMLAAIIGWTMVEKQLSVASVEAAKQR